MTSLEQIVLPLEQSRALVEHGIVLDTAMVWAEMDGGYQCDENGDPQQEIPPYADVVPGDSPYHGTFICPAPTLGELLDAIRKRAKVKYAEIEGLIVLCQSSPESACCALGDYDHEDSGNWVEETQKTAPTDLLAASALLREVSK